MHSRHTYPYRREPAWTTEPSLWGAIKSRPKLLLRISLISFAVFALLILTLPKGYESHMKLRLGPQGDPVLADAGDAKTSTVVPVDTLDRGMNLELQVLKSADTLTQVVLKTGLQKLEVAEDHGKGETTSLTVEKALQRLQQALTVTRVGGSNVVDLSYSAPTPELATAVLQHLASVYPAARIQVYGNPGNYKFLHRQSVVWHRLMDEAENDLVHFRRRYSDFVLPEERDELGKRAIDAQTAFEQADAQVAQYRKKVAQARQMLKRISPGMAQQNRAVLNTDSVARAVLTLFDVTGRKTDLLKTHLTGRVPPDGQLLREADGRIRDAKLALNRTLSQASIERASDSNPVHQNAEMNLIASETELAGLEALRDHLRQIADGHKKEMFRLADAEVRDNALFRQVKQTEEQYLLYSRRQEQAITDEELAKESIINFGIVQRPTVPIEPATPHVAIDLSLSLLLSIACGLATVLCAAHLKPNSQPTYSALKMMALEAGFN